MYFMRLLERRSLDFLTRMDDEERTALLTELLAEDPSEAAWQSICELFAQWPDDAARAEQLERADRALESWDDALRSASAASDFLMRLGQVSPLARLVRSVEFYRHEEHGPDDLLALAKSEHVSRLTRLSIVRSDVGIRAWEVAIESPNLSRLRHLHVRRTTLQESSFPLLWRSAAFTGLQCLKLSGVGLAPRKLDPARQSIVFTELRRLDLSQNRLGDEGVRILAGAPWLQRIERLGLRRNFVRAPAVESLLRSPYAGSLQELDVAENAISGAEMSALAALAAGRGIRLS